METKQRSLYEFIDVNNDKLVRRRDQKRGPSWNKKMGKEKAERMKHKYRKSWIKRFGPQTARKMLKKSKLSWDRKYGKVKAALMRLNLKKRFKGKTRKQIGNVASKRRERRARMMMN